MLAIIGSAVAPCPRENRFLVVSRDSEAFALKLCESGYRRREVPVNVRSPTVQAWAVIWIGSHGLLNGGV
jgi:hypothetical protein